VSRPPLAFVHDHIVQRGGGERVLLAMTRAFPATPVYTSFYRPELTFPEFANLDVRPMPADRVGVLRKHHRAALPIFPLLYNRLHVDADVVICSSSGWAQGARVGGRKLIFFQALAQWLHASEHYLANVGPAARWGVATLRPWLTRWDRRTVETADRLAVCGGHMRDLVRQAYGMDAEIVPPPIAVDPSGPQSPIDGVEPGFFMTASRLLTQKHVDAVIGAFHELPGERLIVAGDGPERDRLAASAPRNVTFLGNAGDEQLRWLYAHARALVSAAAEPYGLTPAEAASFGTPTVAIDEGGLRDSVIEGETGWRFATREPQVVAAAVRRAVNESIDRAGLDALARRHTPEVFQRRLRELVAELGATPPSPPSRASTG